MSKKTATIRARIDPELKEEGDGILDAIGLSQSDFLAISYRQLVMRRGLPFDLRLPNEETEAALNEDFSKVPIHKGSTKELFATILNDRD